MKNFSRLLLTAAICIFASCTQVFAQTTKVRGRVSDAETGEPVPFAAVYFKGTTVGITTDLDGAFALETRDQSSSVLVISLLGYEEHEVLLKTGAYNQLDIKLIPVATALTAGHVKADDHKVRRLFRNIQDHRKANDPSNIPFYSCDTYTKMELDISSVEQLMKDKVMAKSFGFILDYRDTSIVSGKSYLPTMISETIAKNWHTASPSVNKEEIIANRISGVKEFPTLAQFTGDAHAKIDFYGNFLSIMDVEIPSPVNSSGFMFYNYYLIDSLQVDGRKTYKVRFHPDSGNSSPVLDGEMQVDAEDFALKSVKAKLVRAASVNWIKDLVLEAEAERTDSGWFPKNDKMYIEFSVEKKDSSGMMTFFATRQINYSNPVFSGSIPERLNVKTANVIMNDNEVMEHGDDYWNAVRPFELSEKEQKIYSMVDSIKTVPLYQNLYDTAEMIVRGYLTVGSKRLIAIGPYYKMVSTNPLEGCRLQFGGRTTEQYSHKYRLTVSAAYGLKDGKFKGSGSFEYLMHNPPLDKITASVRHDIVQLGVSEAAFTESNILNSIFTKGDMRLCPVNEWGLKHERDWTPGFFSTLAVEHRRIFGNSYVPLLASDGSNLNSVQFTQLRLSGRWSWNEIVTRNVFDRYPLYSDYPVITFNVSGAYKGILGSDYSYLRPEIQIDYRLSTPPAGISYFKLNAGKIFGTVPYPMLKIHEGNGSYFFDSGAFACMNYYEFVSDQWVTLRYHHDFKGFFLGKIPLLKKLGWREVVALNAAFGSVSDSNDGTAGGHSPVQFPSGLSSLEKPYVEAGIGITNIFKLLRVDFYHRLTHTDVSPWTVNVGYSLSF